MTSNIIQCPHSGDCAQNDKVELIRNITKKPKNKELMKPGKGGNILSNIYNRITLPVKEYWYGMLPKQ